MEEVASSGWQVISWIAGIASGWRIQPRIRPSLGLKSPQPCRALGFGRRLPTPPSLLAPAGGSVIWRPAVASRNSAVKIRLEELPFRDRAADDGLLLFNSSRRGLALRPAMPCGSPRGARLRGKGLAEMEAAWRPPWP